MRKWCIAGAIVAVCGGLVAVPIMAQDKQERDNAKLERELESLEAQREKIDAQIRDIHRRMGRGDREVRIQRSKDLSPEQRKEVERAVEEAHRAVRESLKNLPDVKAFVVPDVKEHLKVFADPEFKEHFKAFAIPDGKFEKMSPEEQRKFELKMKEFGEKMGRMGEEMAKKFENFKFEKFDFDGPDARVYKLAPREGAPDVRVFRRGGGKDAPEVRVLRPRSGDDGDMRRELEELRRELRELREEMKKNRSGKTTSAGSTFDL